MLGSDPPKYFLFRFVPSPFLPFRFVTYYFFVCYSLSTRSLATRSACSKLRLRCISFHYAQLRFNRVSGKDPKSGLNYSDFLNRNRYYLNRFQLIGMRAELDWSVQIVELQEIYSIVLCGQICS